jgi:hypothetical protein
MPNQHEPFGPFFSKADHDKKSAALSALSDRADRIDALFSRLWVRIALSVLILVSLLPHEAEPVSDLVFFVVFGAELGLRVYVLVARLRAPRDVSRARSARKTAVSIILLAFDLLALLSFVPWGEIFEGIAIFESRLLRVFRLLRMLLLVGYWSPVLKDGLAVLARHDRLRQVSLLGLVVALLAFAGATIIAHLPVSGVDFTGDGRVDAADEAFWPRLWWAFRQIQDPGNMVTDPGELVVVMVSLALTVAGLFVVSFLIGLAADIVRELVEVARNRPVGWKRHTVVVYQTPGLPELVTELMRFYEKLFRRPRFVVADVEPEPPPALRTGELARVRWRQVDERGTGLIDMTDVATARRVVISAAAKAPFPDAQTAATILDVREATQDAWVVAEILDPNNIAAARVAGGPRTVVVATEKLIGIWALAAIRRPEQMALAWELLATRGGYEIYTYYFDADGLEGLGPAWDAGTYELSDLVETAAKNRWRDHRHRHWMGGVVPIGVVLERRADTTSAVHPKSPEDGELVLNPRGPLGGRNGRNVRKVRAIIAIAEHFDGVRGLARYIYSTPTEPAGGPQAATDATEAAGREFSREVSAPGLGRSARPRRHRKVLMGGFRPGTAVVLAGLCSDGPEVEVTLVMRHGDSVRAATQTLREHGLGSLGVPTSAAIRCFAGHFEAMGDETENGPMAYRWVPLDGKEGGTVRLVQADWTSERTLIGLEPGIDHIARYELVLMLGSHLPEYDGRTSMAVLKIADIARQSAARFATQPEAFRVIAGIADTELGKRLQESYRKASGRDLELLATESLRALFMFQSVAVPGWETIFTSLLGPGEEGLLRLPIEPSATRPSDTSWSIMDLARAYYERGLLVIGVELERDGQTVRRLVSNGAGETFTESELVAVWAIGDEG